MTELYLSLTVHFVNHISRQKMIVRVLEQNKDTDVLDLRKNGLQMSEDSSDALSGEAYVNVPYLKSVLHLLRRSTLTESNESTDLTKKIKSRALGELLH